MIRFAKESDRPAVRELFDLCFPDESGFNAHFFEHVFRASRTLLLEQDGALCATLQMLPYRLLLNGQEGEATYIYGACTHPDQRRKHYMAQLLGASFAEDRRCGRIASFLIPQEEWLFDFYEPFGYLPFFSLDRKKTLQPCAANADIRQLIDWRQADALYTRAAGEMPCRILRSEADWEAQLVLFRALGAGAFGLYESDRLTAYAFVWREDNGLFAQELIAEDDRRAELLAQALLQQLGGSEIHYCTVGCGQKFGCLKPYQAAPARGYINLMFN